MKKFNTPRNLLAALAIFSATGIAAQQKGDIAYVKNPAPATATTATEDAFLKAHPNLQANFEKNFPSATGASWSSIDKAYQVSFTDAGKKARAVFNEKEEMGYVIIEHAATDVPAAVSAIYQPDYKGYAVFNLREVRAHNATAFYVVLENAGSFVTLKVAGGDYEELGRTKKTAAR